MAQTKKDSIALKRIAREAAVQFMYQQEINPKPEITEEYGREFFDTYIEEADFKFFKKLILNFNKDINFNEIISSSLKDGKSLDNASLIARCVIKTAIVEMIYLKTAIPVIINEYVEIAKGFLEKSSVKFLNALLDNIAKQVERKCL